MFGLVHCKHLEYLQSPQLAFVFIYLFFLKRKRPKILHLKAPFPIANAYEQVWALST